MNKLTVKSEVLGTVFTLVWNGKETEFTDVIESVENDVYKWRDYGLHEWVGPRDKMEPRTTLKDDPNFIKHVAEYMRRCYNFTLEEEG